MVNPCLSGIPLNYLQSTYSIENEMREEKEMKKTKNEKNQRH